MPGMNYTPAQKAAVEYSGGNLLLSAAAGSGKTAALTGRIARLITEEGASLSEMLIVTFTRAAAAEMRERIGKRLTEALNEAKAAGDEQVTARAAAPEDLDEIALYLRDYCGCFGLDERSILDAPFTVVTPDSANPYKQMYVAN